MRWNTGYVDNFAQKERWERSVTRGRFGALTGGVTDDGALVASAVVERRRGFSAAAATRWWCRDSGSVVVAKKVGRGEGEGERDCVG